MRSPSKLQTTVASRILGWRHVLANEQLASSYPRQSEPTRTKAAEAVAWVDVADTKKVKKVIIGREQAKQALYRCQKLRL